MAENENLKQQFQQWAAEKERPQEEEAARRCKYCGTDLEEDSLFCPQCGEQSGGSEHLCQICNTKTTLEICPHCGNRVIPVNCPQCGTPSFFDACENCGTLLNQELAAFSAEEKKEPQVMSSEDALKIEETFKQEPVTPEFEKFQKKLMERQTLLEERDYFRKREKRIIQVFGARPFSLELPDPEEEAFRMKAYAALEKTVIERQEKLLQEEWERLFPEEKTTEANQSNVQEAMEKRYHELLAQIGDEVEAHRIVEEKRKEEERRRKEKEEERRRLEQEMFKKRVLGTYYFGRPGQDYEYIMLRITSTSHAECEHHCDGHGNSYGKFSVRYDGYNISLSCLSLSSKHCPLLHSVIGSGFTGTINNTGTIISGHWGTIPVSHYKR